MSNFRAKGLITVCYCRHVLRDVTPCQLVTNVKKSHCFHLEGQESGDLLDPEAENSAILGHARDYVPYVFVNIS